VGRILKKTIFSITLITLLSSSLSACGGGLSTEEAGRKYLEIICPGNTAWLGDVELTDLKALRAAAADARDIFQARAKGLSDPSIQWPSGVPELLKVLRKDALSSVVYFENLALAETLDDFWSDPPPDRSQFSEVAQEVRLILNLSADTVESCKNYKKVNPD
jgi:hypothetical protein